MAEPRTNRQHAIETLRSLALRIAEDMDTDINVEINVDKKKGIAKIKITEYIR